METKNVIAAIALSSAVIVLYSLFFIPEKPAINKNLEQKKGYKETDILGGIDPYSASKASAEILFYSYFKTFIHNKKNLINC